MIPTDLYSQRAEYGRILPICETVVMRPLELMPVGEVAISSIVSAELWYGVAFSQKKKENEAALKEFLQ